MEHKQTAAPSSVSGADQVSDTGQVSGVDQVSGADQALDTAQQPAQNSSELPSESQSQLAGAARRGRRIALLGGLLALVTVGSAAIGTILGVSLSSSSPGATGAAAGAKGEAAAFSLSELWRRGVRYQVARPVNILLMGVDHVMEDDRESRDTGESKGRRGREGADVGEGGDDVRFAGRSDTLLLVRLSPDDQAVKMLSIPRDTLVTFPGRSGVTKINHANLLGGPKLAAEVVSHNFRNVDVDRYVRFNTAAFRELVDLLGGVDVFVPQDMYYVDQTQGLYIDLKAGQQRLDGEQAEQFARFRSDGNGDIGRVQRQQVLLGALRDRLASPAILTKIPAIISLLRTQIDTNLSGEELLAMVNFALELERSDIDMVMLPGHFSQGDKYFASYWVPDVRDVSRVMKDYFQATAPPRLSRPMAERLTLAPARANTLPEGSSFQQTLRIAVQNASEEPYSARQMAQYLREQGFEQVYVISDSPTAQAQTQIIAQRGDVRGAVMLEQILGLGNVVSTSTGDLRSDLTIRVGRDWSSSLDI
ncbi:MAG: LCP family protein [Elainellaceae cyanobacterium]